MQRLERSEDRMADQHDRSMSLPFVPFFFLPSSFFFFLSLIPFQNARVEQLALSQGGESSKQESPTLLPPI